MRQRAIALVAWCGLFAVPANAATDWLEAIERFAKADAAAILCAKPRPDLRQSFIANYEAVGARARAQLKAQSHGLSDAGAAQLVRQRAHRSASEITQLLKQKNCRGRETEFLLQEYQKLAGGVMFPLR